MALTEEYAAKGREGSTALLSRLVTAMSNCFVYASQKYSTVLTKAALWHRTESPATPGIYWFKSKTMAKALKVEVREINGELTVWWPMCDKPITHLKGYWKSVH